MSKRNPFFSIQKMNSVWCFIAESSLDMLFMNITIRLNFDGRQRAMWKYEWKNVKQHINYDTKWIRRYSMITAISRLNSLTSLKCFEQKVWSFEHDEKRRVLPVKQTDMKSIWKCTMLHQSQRVLTAPDPFGDDPDAFNLANEANCGFA